MSNQVQRYTKSEYFLISLFGFYKNLAKYYCSNGDYFHKLQKRYFISCMKTVKPNNVRVSIFFPIVFSLAIQ